MTLPGYREEFGTVLRVTPGHHLGRIIEQNRHFYQVATIDSIVTAQIKGRLLFASDGIADLPKVGDWVEITFDVVGKCIITATLHRFSTLSRKVVGKRSDEQVLVTNIDQVIVVQSADSTFNIRRVERFVVMAKESGADVAVVLSKCDLPESIDAMIDALQHTCPSIPIFPCSAVQKMGVDALYRWIKPQYTVVIIGPSGVGKSTLINTFLNAEIQSTSAVNVRHSKGTHTTVKRELIRLPNGGVIIDTPGLREIQIWDADEGIMAAFDDIDSLAKLCRFTDCTHHHESQCAVKDAVLTGKLSPDRLEHYQKLQSESKTIATTRQRFGDQRKKKHLVQAKKRYNTRSKPDISIE